MQNHPDRHHTSEEDDGVGDDCGDLNSPHGDDEDEEDPTLRPLDGMTPQLNDENQRMLSEKMGYDEEETRHCGDVSGSHGSLPPIAVHEKGRLLLGKPAAGHVDAVHIPPGWDQLSGLNYLSIEQQNSIKVDALLRELKGMHDHGGGAAGSKASSDDFDELQSSSSKLAGLSSVKAKHSVKFGLGAPSPAMLEDIESGVKGAVAAQIAALKKDLKRRDDRLSRLVEHNSLLQNNCDTLT